MTDNSYLYQYFLEKSPDDKKQKEKKENMPAAKKLLTKTDKEDKKHE